MCRHASLQAGGRIIAEGDRVTNEPTCLPMLGRSLDRATARDRRSPELRTGVEGARARFGDVRETCGRVRGGGRGPAPKRVSPNRAGRKRQGRGGTTPCVTAKAALGGACVKQHE